MKVVLFYKVVAYSFNTFFYFPKKHVTPLIWNDGHKNPAIQKRATV